ncbi:unnamed protein product [Symbiodinium microadriaticum]|nr:unnamed protein product [Symbiodinium microadriaticum]
MTSKQINAAIAADQEGYNADLEEYEASRRSGKRFRGEKSTTVSAETRQGMSTRRVLGFLWTEALLKKHGEADLWGSLPKQGICHMGKMIQGVLRDKFVPGAIEVAETSDTHAARNQIAADCEADEVDQADAAFQNLASGLKMQEKEVDFPMGDEGSATATMLKHAKRPKQDDEHDDFTQIWGMNSLASTSSGAGSSRGDKEKDETESKPKKIRMHSSSTSTKAQASSLSDGQLHSETSSNAEGVGFGQGKGAGKSGQKENKELDATEKVLQQHNNFKNILAQQNSFMSLTFQKINGHSEKLSARNTLDLQKTYRDLSNEQTDGRACEIMEKEATAETMLEALTEARKAGLVIPAAADKLCMARMLLQKGKAGMHEEFLLLVESADLRDLFKDDVDSLKEFQFVSVKSVSTKILNEELEAPGFQSSNPGETVSAEQKQQREAKRRDAIQQLALDRTKQLLDFISGFQSKTFDDWVENHKDNVQLMQWLDDVAKLHILTVSVLQQEEEALTGEKLDELKNARNHLLSKKSSLVESMTLWPLGQFIQQAANSRMEIFLRDQSLKAEVQQCIQLSSQLKTFTCDTMFKPDSLEIAVPGLNKVVEMVSKFNMAEQLGSKRFLQEHQDQLKIIGVKITELQNAMLSACVHKFRKSVGEGLRPLLETLLGGQIDADSTARLVEFVNEAENFNPVQTSMLNKCLGASASPIQDAVQETRTFWTRFSSVTSAVVGLMNAETVNCVVQRLLSSDLLALMEIYNDPSKIELLQKLCVDLWPQMSQIGDTIRRSAMHLLAKESASFSQFCVFMAKPDNAKEVLVKEIVGEFQGDEDFFPMKYQMIVHIASWTKDLGGMSPSRKVLGECPSSPADIAKLFNGCRMHLLCEKTHEAGKFMHTLKAAFEASETTGHEVAKSFVQSCAAKAPTLLDKLVDMVKEDVTSLIADLISLHSSVSVRDQFKTALDNGALDAKLSFAMCSDESVQKIYRFLNFGLEDFIGLKQVMIAVCSATTNLGSTGSFDMSGFETTAANAKEVIHKLTEFIRAPESQDEVPLQSISSMVANATMVQACTRDLQTGEARTSLVNKALLGIKKRQWKLHPLLTQRCTEVLSGKSASKTAGK